LIPLVGKQKIFFGWPLCCLDADLEIKDGKPIWVISSPAREEKAA